MVSEEATALKKACGIEAHVKNPWALVKFLLPFAPS